MTSPVGGDPNSGASNSASAASASCSCSAVSGTSTGGSKTIGSTRCLRRAGGPSGDFGVVGIGHRRSSPRTPPGRGTIRTARSVAARYPISSRDGTPAGFVIRFACVEFASSARRHQVEDRFEDADIVHAIDHALYAGDDGDDPDRALYLGPDRAARLLEVVVAVRADGTEVVIHAMKMRSRYQPLLSRPGSSDA